VEYKIIKEEKFQDQRLKLNKKNNGEYISRKIKIKWDSVEEALIGSSVSKRC